MSPLQTAPFRRADFRVALTEHPGWCAGEGRVPDPGERVLCVDGEAEVVRVLGRTGDGGRLVELHLLYGPKAPYFAASSNVLRRSARGGDPPPGSGPATASEPTLGGTIVELMGAPRGSG
jgi:hypothetical protein